MIMNVVDVDILKQLIEYYQIVSVSLKLKLI